MKLLVLRTALILTVLEIANFNFAYSQGEASKVFKLPALTDVSKVSWRDSVYFFPEFKKGKITYTKGFELDYLFDLNYNIYYEKMDFISATGDTLNITNTMEIKLIQVGDKLFFHDYYTGFYEVLSKQPVALAVRNKFVLNALEYNSGVKKNATAMEVRGVVTDYDRLYNRGCFYFFIDTNNELHKATRTSILKLFPMYTVEIQAYLMENPVNFESREDLVKLTNFCNQFLLDKDGDDEKNFAEKNTVKLRAGQSFPSDYPRESFYRFPEFQEAKITWTNKSSAYHPLKVNYNLFTGTMDVVDEKSDTVKLKKWREVRILNLDGSIFYQDFRKGYMEIIAQGPLGLAIRKNFALVQDKDRLEDEGFEYQADASIMSNQDPVTKYDRLYQLDKTYFFMDKRNQFHEASKLSILKLMPRDREKIVAFINENKTSFKKVQDLINLINFCNQLLLD